LKRLYETEKYSINNNSFFAIKDEYYNASKIFGRNFKTGDSLSFITYGSSYGINRNSKKEKFVLNEDNNSGQSQYSELENSH